VLGDLGRGDLDLRMRTDSGRNLLIGVAALTQALDLVADHADESVYRELFRRKSSLVAQRFLCTKRFFNGVLFTSLLRHTAPSTIS
jgi:hypothetical protein